MEPFSPQDPLWKLMGRARQPAPRENFVSEVVQLAKQTPQDAPHRWSRVKDSLVTLWTALSGPFKLAENARSTPAWGLRLTCAAFFALLLAWAFFPSAAPLSSQAQNQPTTQDFSTDVLRESDLLISELEADWTNLGAMENLLKVQDSSELSDSDLHLLLTSAR